MNFPGRKNRTASVLKWVAIACAALYIVSKLEVGTKFASLFGPKVAEKDDLIRNLSIALHKSRNKIGRLSCQLSKDNFSASETGGWCAAASRRTDGYHISDDAFAKTLSNYFAGKRLASFGDGPGYYREYVLSLKQVAGYDAFDGAPFVEEQSNGTVRYIDLSAPIHHLGKYDWVMSVEVAEHVPAQFEAIYLDNVVRHAIEGVILSWARIGQGGHSHINCRDFPYVKLQMESRGFYHDRKASEFFSNEAKTPWIKDNIQIFRRK